METNKELSQEQKKALEQVLHRTVKLAAIIVPPGAFIRDSKPNLPPDSRVSVNINGKEIETTEAELEDILKRQDES